MRHTCFRHHPLVWMNCEPAWDSQCKGNFPHQCWYYSIVQLGSFLVAVLIMIVVDVKFCLGVMRQLWIWSFTRSFLCFYHFSTRFLFVWLWIVHEIVLVLRIFQMSRLCNSLCKRSFLSFVYFKWLCCYSSGFEVSLSNVEWREICWNVMNIVCAGEVQVILRCRLLCKSVQNWSTDLHSNLHLKINSKFAFGDSSGFFLFRFLTFRSRSHARSSI